MRRIRKYEPKHGSKRNGCIITLKVAPVPDKITLKMA